MTRSALFCLPLAPVIYLEGFEIYWPFTPSFTIWASALVIALMTGWLVANKNDSHLQLDGE